VKFGFGFKTGNLFTLYFFLQWFRQVAKLPKTFRTLNVLLQVYRPVVPNLSRLAAPCRRELYFAAASGEPIQFCFKVWWQFENVFL